MNNREIPTEYKDKFQLIFVDQGVWPDQSKMDQRLKDWVAGRMEIRRYEDIHGNNMEHYCTPRTDQWTDFCHEYNGKWINKSELDGVIKTLKTKFFRLDEDYRPIF